ncbi:MAG: hypothetical protein U1D30_16850 [Planctomycetota bacterium]
MRAVAVSYLVLLAPTLASADYTFRVAILGDNTATSVTDLFRVAIMGDSVSAGSFGDGGDPNWNEQLGATGVFYFENEAEGSCVDWHGHKWNTVTECRIARGE